MQVSTLIWLTTIGLILALILIDLFTSSRTAHDVSFKEATGWTAFYVSVSVAFGLWVWSYFGSTFGTEFFAAYLVEYSLSIDNLFIFVIILAQFAVFVDGDIVIRKQAHQLFISRKRCDKLSSLANIDLIGIHSPDHWNSDINIGSGARKCHQIFQNFLIAYSGKLSMFYRIHHL